MTFVVEGEEIAVPKRFLAMHSPHWAQKFEEDVECSREELSGTAASFRSFVAFLYDGIVCSENVLDVLRWGKEFGVDYVSSQCDHFLLSSPMEPTALLHLAAEHEMPMLYSRAMEVVAQNLHSVKVPEDHECQREVLPPIFAVKSVRDDILRAHISMNMCRGDVEQRMRHRFSDHTALSGSKQRARVHWKSRRKPVPPEEPDLDWRKTETVWPHHSLRGEDWSVVPAETQPTMPHRFTGLAAVRQINPEAGVTDLAKRGLNFRVREWNVPSKDEPS
eukprot:CAMPEP_0194487392 /NCGR_PEP_ID=MMETSP0253-20130528/7686_1 /TAXON_ID=2966 /ORGANISM="Noctiluca scintillans" /LENGTH=275 /DNA_ID=CAMNT_0039327607 /DNA_START=120 /DNA_END=942 /DNA_ORIENTATION=-